MNVMRRALFAFVAVSSVVFMQPAVAEWQPDPDDKRQVAAKKAADDILRKHPKLRPYFDAAVGYAVFPRVYRLASLWGGAWGRGAVIEGDRYIGSTWLGLIGVGLQLGGQTYDQIIFFKTQEALDAYKRKWFEFNGRTSLAVIAWGASADPAYIPDVAVFTDVEIGLMFEASGSVVWYNFKEAESAAPDEPSAETD